MKIRSFKDLYTDLSKTGYNSTSNDIIIGEEYEDWLKERFIQNVDGGKTNENDRKE